MILDTGLIITFWGHVPCMSGLIKECRIKWNQVKSIINFNGHLLETSYYVVVVADPVNAGRILEPVFV